MGLRRESSDVAIFAEDIKGELVSGRTFWGLFVGRPDDPPTIVNGTRAGPEG